MVQMQSPVQISPVQQNPAVAAWAMDFLQQQPRQSSGSQFIGQKAEVQQERERSMDMQMNSGHMTPQSMYGCTLTHIHPLNVFRFYDSEPVSFRWLPHELYADIRSPDAHAATGDVHVTRSYVYSILARAITNLRI